MKYAQFLAAFCLFFIFEACCPDENPTIDCAQGIEVNSYPSKSVDDTTYNCCPNCPFDHEEVYSSAIPFDYTTPCFNPLNSNQVVYYRYDNSKIEVGFEIWVVDLCTNDRKKIADNALYGIDWGASGWIAYTADDQNIYKIKPNGDSLTQLTFIGEYNRYPKWDLKGGRIAYNCQIGNNSHFIILNTNTWARDTVADLWTSGAWNWLDENRLTYATASWNSTTGVTTQYLRIFDLQNKQSTLLHTLNIADNNDSLLISTDYALNINSIVWCAYGTIGRTNINTGQFKIIKSAYRQESFYNAVVSGDQKFILFDLRSRKLIDNCHYDSDYGLYIMDLNGQNHRRIMIE